MDDYNLTFPICKLLTLLYCDDTKKRLHFKVNLSYIHCHEIEEFIKVRFWEESHEDFGSW
jgi:hypothetical protein